MDEFLPLCTHPILILHAEHDPVVSVKSAYKIIEAIGNADKQLTLLPARKHGILMENIAGTWGLIDAFMVKSARLV